MPTIKTNSLDLPFTFKLVCHKVFVCLILLECTKISGSSQLVHKKDSFNLEIPYASPAESNTKLFLAILI